MKVNSRCMVWLSDLTNVTQTALIVRPQQLLQLRRSSIDFRRVISRFKFRESRIMNMSSTTFLNTFTPKTAFVALKAAKHPGISVSDEWIEMLGEMYRVAFKDYTKDQIERRKTRGRKPGKFD